MNNKFFALIRNIFDYVSAIGFNRPAADLQNDFDEFKRKRRYDRAYSWAQTAKTMRGATKVLSGQR